MSLEIKTKNGTTELRVDGHLLKNVKLVTIEAEPGTTVVQIEMMPDFEARLTDGETIHWMVCCPNCEHNSIHTCMIDDDLEPEFRKVEEAFTPIPPDADGTITVPVPPPASDVLPNREILVPEDFEDFEIDDEAPGYNICNDSYQMHLRMTDGDPADHTTAFCTLRPHGNEVKHQEGALLW